MSKITFTQNGFSTSKICPGGGWLSPKRPLHALGVPISFFTVPVVSMMDELRCTPDQTFHIPGTSYKWVMVLGLLWFSIVKIFTFFSNSDPLTGTTLTGHTIHLLNIWVPNIFTVLKRLLNGKRIKDSVETTKCPIFSIIELTLLQLGAVPRQVNYYEIRELKTSMLWPAFGAGYKNASIVLQCLTEVVPPQESK